MTTTTEKVAKQNLRQHIRGAQGWAELEARRKKEERRERLKNATLEVLTVLCVGAVLIFSFRSCAWGPL